MSDGLIHLYLGDGKGKTTASVGLAARAAGCGRSVLFGQFLKGGRAGEVTSLEKLGVKIIRSERSLGFTWKMSGDEQEDCRVEQRRLLHEICEAAGGAVGLVIFDEALDVVNTDKIAEQGVRDFIAQKPEGLEVVFTGRSAPDWLMERADYITKMTKIKHPYDCGIKARESIEY